MLGAPPLVDAETAGACGVAAAVVVWVVERGAWSAGLSCFFLPRLKMPFNSFLTLSTASGAVDSE